jgi:hypothetical protein
MTNRLDLGALGLLVLLAFGRLSRQRLGVQLEIKDLLLEHFRRILPHVSVALDLCVRRIEQSDMATAAVDASVTAAGRRIRLPRADHEFSWNFQLYHFADWAVLRCCTAATALVVIEI